jgi:hypothetical protein
MSDESKGKIEIAPGVVLNAELNERHLVDMQVSIKEEQLHKEESALIRDLNELSRESGELHSKRAAAISKVCEAQQKTVLDTVAPAFKAMGATRVDAKYDWSEDGTKKRISNVVSIVAESRKKNDAISGEVKFYKSVAFPAEVKKIDARLADLDKEMAKIRKNLQEVKTDLSDIPRIERQARARLAMETLKATPAGKILAKTLEIKALPAPRKK